MPNDIDAFDEIDPLDPLPSMAGFIPPGLMLIGNTNQLFLQDSETGVLVNGQISWYGKTGAVCLYQRTILLEDGVTPFTITSATLTLVLIPFYGGTVQTFPMSNLDNGTTILGECQYLFQPNDISTGAASYVDFFAEIHGVTASGTPFIAPVNGTDLLRFYAEI